MNQQSPSLDAYLNNLEYHPTADLIHHMFGYPSDETTVHE